MMRVLAILSLLGAGCSEALIVEVDVQPGVRDVAHLEVKLTSGPLERTDDLPMGDHSFPVTFSVGTDELAGDLTITINAFDANDIRVGVNSISPPNDATSASLTLETADFVVNTHYDGDQFWSQLTATPDETWTVTYESPADVQGSNNLVSRRYDLLGQLKDTIELPRLPTGGVFAATSVAVLAIRADRITKEIWCDRSEMSGMSTTLLVREPAEQAQIAARSDDTFVVTWQVPDSATPELRVLRAAIVDSQCRLVGGHPAMTIGSSRSSPALRGIAHGQDLLYMWNTPDGALHLRAAHQSGKTAQVLFGSGETLISPDPHRNFQNVIVAGLDDGFGVLVERAERDSATNQLYRVTNMGALAGDPLDLPLGFIISTFGAMPGTAGNWFIAGTDCSNGVTCQVLVRFLHADGTAIDAALPLATTTTNTQYTVSAILLPNGLLAATWNDLSGEPPDTSGSAIRARIFYPPTL